MNSESSFKVSFADSTLCLNSGGKDLSQTEKKDLLRNIGNNSSKLLVITVVAHFNNLNKDFQCYSRYLKLYHLSSHKMNNFFRLCCQIFVSHMQMPQIAGVSLMVIIFLEN